MSDLKNIFEQELVIVNLGNAGFFSELRDLGVEVTHLDWKPPGRGQVELIDALEMLSRRDDIDDANNEAIKRYASSVPVLIDIGRAIDVIPGLNQNTYLHSGAPDHLG